MRRLLLACILITSGCAPIPLLQDARLVRQGRTRYGFAGSIFMPTDADTIFEPDGPGTGPDHDLQFIPLPAARGWARIGLGPGELQLAFQVPSFSISLGAKLGIVGTDPGSPFALAISGDLTGSPVLGRYGFGGTLLTSVRLTSGVSLDLGGRVGTFPGLWDDPVVTPTLGVTIGDPHHIYVVVGGAVPLDSAASGLWLAVGYSR